MMNIDPVEMKDLLTPYKIGRPLIVPSGQPGAFDERAADCPFVFYHNGRWHMTYIGYDGIGYQTAIASSDDLMEWRYDGMILKRDAESGSWDANGAAGTWIVKVSDDLCEIPLLRKINGKYWMTYHSYPGIGYENGPAKIGLAWSEDEDLLAWHRLAEPVFSWEDGAEWESGGLYKSCIVEHDGTFYMFYNAKDRGNPWIEQTGLATSKDLEHWTRCDLNPVVRVTPGAWDSQFVSDPCVVRFGDRWTMFYFGYNGRNAQEGLAISDDLIAWRKSEMPVITNGAPGSIDETHAHKASVVMKDGVLYHFYTAVRPADKGSFRCITVAVSAINN